MLLSLQGMSSYKIYLNERRGPTDEKKFSLERKDKKKKVERRVPVK